MTFKEMKLIRFDKGGGRMWENHHLYGIEDEVQEQVRESLYWPINRQVWGNVNARVYMKLRLRNLHYYDLF
jgi:hypothetical protein